MTPTVKHRIQAFRRAMELGTGDEADACRNMERWNEELQKFPYDSCELASNFLAQYLQEGDDTLCPYIIRLQTNNAFRESETSRMESHYIVALDGDYIDLTLDQFSEHDEYVTGEPIESRGTLGRLINKIRYHAGADACSIQTLSVNVWGGKELYAWLSDKADLLLKTDGQSEGGRAIGPLVSMDIQEKYRTAKD
ncbi:hypothetical protein F4826_004914 [Rahnella inusitata]|nr:hypothetical protein [Rahnella inusitata]